MAGDAFRRIGSLRIAADPEERDEIRAEYEALSGDGIAVEWRDDLDGPLSGRFAALSSTRATARCSPRGGYAAWRGSRPRPAWRSSSTPAFGRSTRRMPRVVVVCTDGYPSGLLGELEGLIVPTRGQVIATEPIAERWYEVPHYGRHGFDYWHQTPDGRIVAGGFRDTSLDSEFTDVEETTGPVQSALEAFVESIAGRPLRVDYRWAGIFGLVLDFLPVVGRVPGDERLWTAGGYSGHGNVLGFLCGDLVARRSRATESRCSTISSRGGCSADSSPSQSDRPLLRNPGSATHRRSPASMRLSYRPRLLACRICRTSCRCSCIGTSRLHTSSSSVRSASRLGC